MSEISLEGLIRDFAGSKDRSCVSLSRASLELIEPAIILHHAEGKVCQTLAMPCRAVSEVHKLVCQSALE